MVVADLDGQIEQFYPLETSAREMLMEGLTALKETGFDPWVGRKLYHWFCRAGLENIRVRVSPYQTYAGSLPERDLANWQEKFTTITNYLGERTGEREKWEQAGRMLMAEIQRPDIFYYCSLIIVCGTVPE